MLHLGTIATAVLSLVVPPPHPVTVDVLGVAGEGCGPGTTSVAISGDGVAFTVAYSDFVVLAHGSDAHKTCELTIRVNHPDDYTYGVAETSFRGFAQLEDGSKGTERASYFFANQAPTVHSPHTFSGPMTDTWEAIDHPVSVVHGPCHERRPLTIKTELKVTGKSAASYLAMDSTDGKVNATVQLSWQKC